MLPVWSVRWLSVHKRARVGPVVCATVVYYRTLTSYSIYDKTSRRDSLVMSSRARTWRYKRTSICAISLGTVKGTAISMQVIPWPHITNVYWLQSSTTLSLPAFINLFDIIDLLLQVQTSGKTRTAKYQLISGKTTLPLRPFTLSSSIRGSVNRRWWHPFTLIPLFWRTLYAATMQVIYTRIMLAN